MKTLAFLIRREFWEHRSAFVVLPAVLTLFFLLLLLLVYTVSIVDMTEIALDADDIEMTLDQGGISMIEQFPSDSLIFVVSKLESATPLRRAEIFDSGLQVLSLPLIGALWAVIFFYLLSCLYGERRDRSFLFWKCMPVSDSMTIISKLITGLWMLPLVYLLGIAALQFSVLVLLTLKTMNTEISAIAIIWGPANIVGKWLGYLEAILFYSLWSLPFSGWLLTVSAFAKSLPLAWAIGVPLGLMVCERTLTGQALITDWLGSHVIPIGFLSFDRFSSENLLARYFSLDMFSALVVGSSLVFLAVWLRSKVGEI